MSLNSARKKQQETIRFPKDGMIVAFFFASRKKSAPFFQKKEGGISSPLLAKLTGRGIQGSGVVVGHGPGGARLKVAAVLASRQPMAVVVSAKVVLLADNLPRLRSVDRAKAPGKVKKRDEGWQASQQQACRPPAIDRGGGGRVNEPAPCSARKRGEELVMRIKKPKSFSLSTHPLMPFFRSL